MDELITKEQFLVEHNKLSPLSLQATLLLLTKFQEEKKPMLKNAEWSNKLRIHFISWMLALPKKKEKNSNKLHFIYSKIIISSLRLRITRSTKINAPIVD